jgi:hypothetical protein
MNHCEMMSDALDDAALGRIASESLRVHLVQCSACTAELERRRALAGRIDAAVVAIVSSQPSSRLPARIAAQIRGAAQTGPSIGIWPRIAVGAALAASVATLIVGVRAIPPPATHNHELSTLSAWRSPTSALMAPRGSIIAAPLRDTWFDAEPGTSHTGPMPGVSHAL